MAYLQDLLNQQNQQIAISETQNRQFVGDLGGRAYAQYFPTWEVTAPQYMTPVAWSLAHLGYKTNEVAYACIGLKMRAIAEPPLRIYDKDTDKVVDNDEFQEFIKEPCPGVSETEFHAANQMYLDIAGFMSWEKDTANDGTLLHVWPMMPQYCSFMRGQGQLLRVIRYQPYTGLPYNDILRERVVFMSYQDPQYFGLRPLSPTAIMADIIGVDNDTTNVLQNFLKNGTFADGLLKTDQIINDADAAFARERWRESHGGAANAGQIAVLGKGLEWVRSSATFREMVFPEVDARSETRICMGYSVPPILVSAKSGMDRATYSNYEQARAAWYEEFVSSQWAFLARAYTRDLLPHFDDNPKHELRFDTSKVRALENSRVERMRWVVDMAKANILTRDETRTDLGKDPIDNAPVFIGIATQQQLQEVQDFFEPGGGKDTVTQGEDTAYAVNEKQKAEEAQGKQPDQQPPAPPKEDNKAEKAAEKMRYYRFSENRMAQKKYADLPQYEFKYLSDDEQRQIIEEVTGLALLKQLEEM